MVVRLHASAGGTPPETLTDAEGRYVFKDVLPGKYAVEVANDEHRSTYLRQWLGHEGPAANFGGPPRYEIEVTAAADRTGLDVVIMRAMSIAGRVVGPFGEGLANVPVNVKRADGRPINDRAAHTDDLGAYRIYGLAPGRYRVCADVRERLDDGGDPIALPMAPSCHPAALTPADAADVSVGSRDVSGIDIEVQRLGGRTISGAVADTSGAPVDGAWVAIHRVNEFTLSASVRTRAGAFSVSGLLPGRYLVAASTGNAPPGFGPAGGPAPEVAYVQADITAVDASNVHLKTAPPRTVTGRLIFAGSAPSTHAGLKVFMRPGGEVRSGMLGPQPSAPVNGDGTFELSGVYAVPFVLDVTGLPAGWALANVKLNDADVTFRSSDFTAGARPRVEVLVTNQVSSPVVRVVDERGEPVARARIVATPRDPALWRNGFRWNDAVSAADGFVRLPSMMPGEYLMAALLGEDATVFLYDADRLDDFGSFATAVRLDRGETRVTLPLTRLPEKK
jgi:hypothetical protein